MKKAKSRRCSKAVNKIEFEITESVISEMNQYRQMCGGEVGGVLMGSVIGNNKIRINRISTPCIAKSSTYSFERDAKMANSYISSEFEQSNHTRVYVGEWHTHPEQNPTPSNVDYNSIKETFTDSELATKGLLLLIIGQKTDYWAYYNGKCFQEKTPIIV